MHIISKLLQITVIVAVLGSLRAASRCCVYIRDAVIVAALGSLRAASRCVYIHDAELVMRGQGSAYSLDQNILQII